MKEQFLKTRLEQICSNLISEGYRVTGRLGLVRALKHPNGNRITLIASGDCIAYIKNGRFLKKDDVTAYVAARERGGVTA